jgi:dTDP-4-dehydrorhamnose 3,5-epimerase-like enzyme
MSDLIEIKHIKPDFEDERGTISDIILGEKIEHAGIITSKPNTLRGSHFHKLSTQYNYVLEGQIELIIKDVRKDETPEKIILNKGDFVKIPPQIIHALKAITDSTFLVFTSEARIGQNYENDTFRVEL